MIKDNLFVAQVGEDTIVVTADATGETMNVRSTSSELKQLFLTSLNKDHQVPLTPVNPKTYPTGKDTPLKIAASLASISSALQFVEAPEEVIVELQRLTKLPGTQEIRSAAI